MQFWREETSARLLLNPLQRRESLPWQRPLLVGQFEYRINPRALGLEPLTTISRTHFRPSCAEPPELPSPAPSGNGSAPAQCRPVLCGRRQESLSHFVPAV